MRKRCDRNSIPVNSCRQHDWLRTPCTSYPGTDTTAARYACATPDNHAGAHEHRYACTDGQPRAHSHVIPLPAGISDVVSNASVIYQDGFNYSFLSPSGWSACSGFEPIWSAENDHLAINAKPGTYGTVFYYADKMIDPNQAVYFLFAYEGTQGSFTLGFDGYSNGKVCDSAKSKLGFYSVALEHMTGLPLTVHTIVVNDQPTGYFTGDWRLQEDNWYSALMGFDKSNTFFIDIWKPGDPSQKLVFKQTKADFPKTYNFISWLAVTRKLMIDDFTIVKFDEIK